MTKKILVIEDEIAIADTINYALRTEGFTPIWCATGREGGETFKRIPIDLIVLDVGLPDISGFDLCKTIRRSSDIPILFLTARASEIDRIVGLEIGGDDYMVKPFSPRELTARIKAILRRMTGKTNTESDKPSNDGIGKSVFHLDLKKKCIYYLNVPLKLSRYEFKIIVILVSHPGRVFSRTQLMEQIWDVPDVSLGKTITTHIKTIRSKLRAINPNYDPIKTRRGFGYVFEEPE